MLEKLKDNALIVGWIFLLSGWVIWDISYHDGYRPLIPMICFIISVLIFVYDLIRNKI